MARILNVRTSVKEDKTLVIFRTEDRPDDKPVILTAKQVAAACGINTAFHVLRGGDLECVFYKKGEKMISGAECTADDTIVREYTLEVPSSIAQFQGMAVAGLTVSLVVK